MGSLSLWLFYGIPPLSLVVFFLCFLRRPEFKYSFYKVLQCDLMINIFCYLNTWISRLCHVDLSIPLMIWFNDNCYFLFVFYMFFDSFFYNAQSMSIIVTSMHRLWSSKFTGSNEFWRKHYQKIYVSVLIISGLLALLNVYVGVFRPKYYDWEKQAFVKTTLDPMSLSLPYILLTCDYNVQKTIKKILGFIATSKINSGQVGAMMI